MYVDISPLTAVAATLASGVVATCAPLATAWAGRRLGLQARSLLMAEVEAASRAAGGLAYHALASAAGKPASVEIRNAALAAGVQHVLRTAPAALAALGITEAGLEAMIAGELGRLLAADPTVPAGPSAVTSGPM